MPLSGKEILLYKLEEGIVTITLNRPDRLNALSFELFERLNEAWARFRDDEQAKVAILTGAGERAFCAGVDLIDQAERLKRDPDSDLIRVKPGILDATEGTPWGAKVAKPVIAAINGTATGGGFELLMTCDLRIAVPQARLGTSEVRVGRGTPWAMPLLRQLPSAIAFELLALGELLPAERLYQVGWLNALVPAPELQAKAWELAARLRDNAPLSVRAAKESLRAALAHEMQTAVQQANSIHRIVYGSEDAQEGPRAFAEKRRPVWKGR